MRRPHALASLALAFALLAGCLQGGLVGKPTPAFSLITTLGERIDERTFEGRWVVFDLMATWCAPCKLEVGHLKDVQRTLGARVAIVSVDVSPTNETAADLEAFANETGMAWPHGVDWNLSLGRAFDVVNLPKMVIVGPDGKVAFEAQREVQAAQIVRVIDPTLAPSEPPARTTTFATTILAAAAGFLAVLNPYRAFHRAGSRAASWRALAAFVILGGAAWLARDVLARRLAVASLVLGAVALGAALWWLARASRRAPGERPPPSAVFDVADRLYEAAPHYALALVLALGAPEFALAFGAPLAGFALGYAGGALADARLPERQRVAAGLVGLALAGAGLLVLGARAIVQG